jgi:hypothetical protein
VPSIPTAPSGPPNGSLSGAPTGIARSSNKRLSGIIIGDGVRALLEIGSGEEKVTRIVQPGDEVDGILVVRIERSTEGGRTTTRMVIREGNEERYVDLQPSTEAKTPAGGADATGAAASPRGGLGARF